jgi:coproporphyrinogen III oxidase-like Fe-S oxidoreductase
VAGEDPVSGHETLTPGNIAAEMVYLGLRTSRGLDLLPSELEHAHRWIEAGWGELIGSRLRLTPDGWLRLDSIAAILTSIRSL